MTSATERHTTLAFSQMQQGRLRERSQGLVSTLHHQVCPALQRPYMVHSRPPALGTNRWEVLGTSLTHERWLGKTRPLGYIWTHGRHARVSHFTPHAVQPDKSDLCGLLLNGTFTVLPGEHSIQETFSDSILVKKLIRICRKQVTQQLYTLYSPCLLFYIQGAVTYPWEILPARPQTQGKRGAPHEPRLRQAVRPPRDMPALRRPRSRTRLRTSGTPGTLQRPGLLKRVRDKKRIVGWFDLAFVVLSMLGYGQLQCGGVNTVDSVRWAAASPLDNFLPQQGI